MNELFSLFFFTRGSDKKMNLPDNRFFKTILSQGICSIINFNFPGKIVQHVHTQKRVLGIFFISQNISPKRHSQIFQPYSQNVPVTFQSTLQQNGWYTSRATSISFNLICVSNCRYLQFIQNMPQLYPGQNTEYFQLHKLIAMHISF